MANTTPPPYETPEVPKKIVLTNPKKIAGGVPAITSSVKHVYGEVGVASGTQLMTKINQFDGFDCPGCAWPDPDDHRSVVEFCENGAKAVAEEATTTRADPDFFARHSVTELLTWTDYDIGKSGRITHPMLLREGSTHYEPVPWHEAFRLVGEQLQSLASPDEAIFYTSGRTSNEAAFLYQLFVRQYGTNNLPDCSNMCHESTGVGLSETLGIGKGSVTLDDLYQADVIMIMGQNPGTNHPRMLSALQIAKDNGAKIISVNPLPETGLMRFKHPQHPLAMVGTGTPLTDLFLPVRLNEDVALLKAIMKMLLTKEAQHPGTVLDRAFIDRQTSGYEAFLDDLQQYDQDDLIRRTGIHREEIEVAADLLAHNPKIVICWAMGMTQHRNGVDNVREIVNLLLMKGSIGKPGAGTCPVRGHSNVQGDRTVGIWDKLKPELAQKLRENFHFDPPAHEGYDVIDAMQAMADGKASFFMGMGGNFLSATPDTEYTARGLAQCAMTVQVSTKLNRSHLIHGRTALILPCLGRTERDQQASGPQLVSVENSTGVVHQSRGGKQPVSEHLLSEPSIVAQLAKATLGETTTVDWTAMTANYDRIRDAIEATVPGFDHYNERVRRPGGFYLPNGAREGKFATDTGKAKFTVNRPADHALADDEFLMMTIRSHDQYNTTIYGLHDRYRGIRNARRVVLMNEEDVAEAQLESGALVDISSYYDGEERVGQGFTVVPYSIPRRCLGTYFPEANVVIPYHRSARTSHQPISKSVVVKVKRSSER